MGEMKSLKSSACRSKTVQPLHSMSVPHAGQDRISSVTPSQMNFLSHLLWQMTLKLPISPRTSYTPSGRYWPPRLRNVSFCVLYCQ
jgi:hypothetical protein